LHTISFVLTKLSGLVQKLLPFKNIWPWIARIDSAYGSMGWPADVADIADYIFLSALSPKSAGE